MLHVATVHYASARWIEIQTSYLREHISVPYTTWSSLELIDPSHGVHFDHVLEQRGPHPGKLNHLAMEISHEASDDDLLMFLDGDAFPIADPMGMIEEGLRNAALIAVRRAENVGDPQPHPCFCVTRVGTWRGLPGDWSGGYAWAGPKGKLWTDGGANLLRCLELSGTPWVEVLRSNPSRLDPLHFAIYGESIYHHGAGFRTGELSGAHRDAAPTLSLLPRSRVLRAPVRVLNAIRWRSWERATQERHVGQSEAIFERIRLGGTDWLNDLV